MRLYRASLYFIFFLISPALMGQYCGPEQKMINVQAIFNNGNILVLDVGLGGELMLDDSEHEILLYYAVLSDQGEIIKEHEQFVKWPGGHYNIIDCYNSAHHLNGGAEPTQLPCQDYLIMESKDEIIVALLLKNEPRFYALFRINDQGRLRESVERYGEGLSSDLERSRWLQGQLRKRFDARPYPLLAIDSVDHRWNNVSLKTSTRVDEKEHVECDVWVELPDTTMQMTGVWSFNGLGPFIEVREEKLYISFFDHTFSHCWFHGPDIQPRVMVFDHEEGTLLWERVLRMF